MQETLNSLQLAKKKSESLKRGVTQTPQLVKIPEFLLRNRKFNLMEIEMDKFLAKKHAVFQSTPG